MTPLFIVLEGPDGSGTTTQSALLAEKLRNEGYAVTLTAEPTDGVIGRWIREQLRGGTKLDPAALQLMFCADRAQHVEEVIKPALARGEVVVCDRYSPSTLVYSEAQGIDSGWLQDLNKHFIQTGCMIFTLPPLNVCLERIGKRSGRELFETEELQRRIHEGYAKIAAADRSIAVVDTSGSKQESSQQIWDIVQRRLV